MRALAIAARRFDPALRALPEDLFRRARRAHTEIPVRHARLSIARLAHRWQWRPRAMTGESTALLAWPKGSWIKFRLRDVCHPLPERLLEGACGDLVLEGLVIAVSHDGDLQSSLVEIEMRGSPEHLIVKNPSAPISNREVEDE